MAPNITDTENGMIIIMTITIFSLEKMKRILVKKLLERRGETSRGTPHITDTENGIIIIMTIIILDFFIGENEETTRGRAETTREK